MSARKHMMDALPPDVEKMLATAPTLLDKARRNPDQARRIDAKVAELEREYQLEKQIQVAMDSQQVNRTELAQRLGVERSSISRDLNRGLSNASMSRVKQVVDALDYRFLPVILPKDDPTAAAAQFASILASLGITIEAVRKASPNASRQKKSRRKPAAA
jgi:predicted XRE-type DNA-binding protein